MTPRLISVGNVVVDVSMQIDALPERGGDTVASESEIVVGGGFNALVAAQRDGLDCLYAGRVGTGRFADLAQEALHDSGIEVAGVAVPDLDTGFSIVLVDAGAERTFVTSRGAEGELTPEHLGGVTVHHDDVVLVSGYGLAHPRNALALPSWMEALPPEVRVVFDPSPLVAELPEDALRRVLARTDVLTLNTREAGLLCPGASAAGAVPSLAGRIRPGGVVVVRVGADGCWVGGRVRDSAGASPVHVAGFPVDAVDTTGAGDAHTGVLCAALARGASPIDAARRGSAAAALSVTRRGPATGPTTVEIDELLEGALL